MRLNGGAARSPAAIEQQIALTRRRIGRALDAVEDKLTAPQLMKEGVEMMTGWFGGKEGGTSDVREAIRANPIPLALIGAGVAWLVAANSGLGERIAQDERVQNARRRLTDMAGDIGGKVGMDRLTTQRGGGNRWVHQATGAARDAVQSLRDTGDAVMDRAGAYAGYAGDRAGAAGEQLRTIVERYPLLIGAIGLIAGAGIAAMLPTSRTEEGLLRGTRDSLRKKASQLGRDVADRAHSAIDSALGPNSRR
jgi:hypothetical protein